MYNNSRWILMLLLLGVWIIDFIDMRYFYYFFKRDAYEILGMKMHFTVALRYPIAAVKWLLTYWLFPRFFENHGRKIAFIFLTILSADIISVLLIKYDITQTHSFHNFFYSLLRLKIMDNYFLVLIAGLGILDQLSKYHERFPRST
jgi:hypothetical protein